MKPLGRALGIALALAVCTVCPAQQAPPASGSQASQAFTPEQQAVLNDAQKDFAAEHWADADAKLRILHSAAPGNVIIAKFQAEAEINNGQPADALTLLQPILAANADDVQALAISAHAYAQMRRAAERDAALTHLQQLHDENKTRLQQVVMETDALPSGGSVRIFYYLEPWSVYHIRMMARVFDASGKQVRRITLESGDFDQPSFAKEHPDLAAKGERRYSMDGYADQAPGADGKVTQTQALYGFFDGRPSYDTFRDRALAIAQGQNPAAATRSGIPKP